MAGLAGSIRVIQLEGEEELVETWFLWELKSRVQFNHKVYCGRKKQSRASFRVQHLSEVTCWPKGHHPFPLTSRLPCSHVALMWLLEIWPRERSLHLKSVTIIPVFPVLLTS